MKWNVFDSVSVNSSWVSCPGGLEAAPSLEITWLGAWCALPNVIASSGLVYWVLLCVLAWQGGLILSAAGVTGWGHQKASRGWGFRRTRGHQTRISSLRAKRKINALFRSSPDCHKNSNLQKYVDAFWPCNEQSMVSPRENIPSSAHFVLQFILSKCISVPAAISPLRRI